MAEQATPVHDFVLPHLTALVRDALAQGFAKEVVVAVVIDLITAAPFDTAKPSPEGAPHPDYQRAPDVTLIAGENPVSPKPIGAQDQMDFLRPFDWFRD
jgi:hypothetical protein